MNEPTQVMFVLDRTGSMHSRKRETISLFNEYVNGLRALDERPHLSLMQFDTQGIDLLYTDRDVNDIEFLTDETFQPRSGTNLFDAVGEGIEQAKKLPGEKKVVVVLTDGEENSSKEYKKETIKTLLTEVQDERKWMVIFLGADFDAWDEGFGMGVSVSNTVAYASSNVGLASENLVAATANYTSTGDQNAFTSSQLRGMSGEALWKTRDGVDSAGKDPVTDDSNLVSGASDTASET